MVSGDTATVRVHRCEIMLGNGMPLFGRFAVPQLRLRVVLRDSVTKFIQHAGQSNTYQTASLLAKLDCIPGHVGTCFGLSHVVRSSQKRQYIGVHTLDGLLEKRNSRVLGSRPHQPASLNPAASPQAFSRVVNGRGV